MHRGYDRAAYHFIQALGIPSIAKIKGKLSQKKGKKRAKSNDSDNKDDNEVGNSKDPNLDEDEEDEEDVDVSMAIEADADDLEAMATITVTNYDPGDTLRKLTAFVNQLRMSSKLTHNYLVHMCIMQNVKPIKLLLWI